MSQQCAHRQRLAAAEGDVGNAGLGDAPGEVEGFGAGQLIGPRLVRPRLLAAGDAAGAAPVGQLPGEEQGRRVFFERAPLHGERRGSGKADVRLGHHLFRDVLELRGFPRRLGAGLVRRFRGCNCLAGVGGHDRFVSCPFLSKKLDVDYWHPLPLVRLRVGRLVVDRAPQCSSRCFVAPSLPVRLPGLHDAHAPQVGANAWKCRRHLDPAVRKHQQRRRRFQQGGAKPVLDAPGNVAQFEGVQERAPRARARRGTRDTAPRSARACSSAARRFRGASACRS